MSHYIEHTSCPDCGSRDNLTIYTDHEYCFGCGRLVFYTYHNKRIEQVKERDTKTISLPEDIIPSIPSIAEDWLLRYGLTVSELIKNRVVWSEYKSLLIFPYMDDNHYLWGYQGRYFGNNDKHPKWIGHGNFKDQIRIYPEKMKDTGSIILCEDIISTIKLSRENNACCLFGSSIPYNKYITIYNRYNIKEYIIWLDKDKRKDSYIYANKLNKLGINTRVIVTELDPKDYNNEEMRCIIES